MNLRCIVVEDEAPASRLLQFFIRRIPELTLVEVFKNGLAVPAFLTRQPIELMFLDIQMPFLSGTDLLQRLEVRPAVVLTTANPQYALKAFDWDVLDYLVKPFDFERFEKAVKKAMLFHRAQASEPPITAPYLTVKCDYRNVRIQQDEILYIEGWSEYVKIVTVTKKYVTLMSLKDLEGLLPPPAFIRTHKSHLVRTDKIRQFNHRELTLSDGTLLPIGRAYKASIMGFLESPDTQILDV